MTSTLADLKSMGDNLLRTSFLSWSVRALWGVLALVSLLLLFFMPIGYEDRAPITHLIEHWPLGVLLTVLGLIMSGFLGTGLGLPTLFRDDPDQTRWRLLGRSFGAGFGAAMVAIVAWVVIFFCDFITIQERLSIVVPQVVHVLGGQKAAPPAPPAPVELLAGAVRPLPAWHVLFPLQTTLIPLHQDLKAPLATAIAGKDDTLFDHLRGLDNDIVGLLNGMIGLADQPTVFGRFSRDVPFLEARFQRVPIKYYVQVHRIYSALEHIDFDHGTQVAGMRWRLLEGSNLHASCFFGYLMGGLLTIVALMVASWVGIISDEAAKRRWKSPRAAFLEFLGYLSGSLFLVVIAGAMLYGSMGANLKIEHWLMELGADRLASPRFLPEFTRFQDLFDKVNVVVFSVVLFAILFLVLRYSTVPVSAGLVICMLLSLVSLLYLFLVAINPGSQFVVVVGVSIYLLWLNSDPFKYRFPGLDTYYSGPHGPLKLHDVDDEIENKGAADCPGPDAAMGGPLLDDRAVLERWAEVMGKAGGRKPRLVLVTATGAAYRASFWTTVVLEKLSAEIPGFLNHVRLMTGASGGMVGAAYVVHLLQPPRNCRGYSSAVVATQALKNDSQGDSLSAVVRTLIDGDLPRALLPWPQEKDRGRTLEDQWKALDAVTFASLRDGEEDGWRPSLVLSPMIVETGRRLLFSNLDLYGLTDIQARNRKTISVDPIDLKPLPKQGGHRRLSRSAVEFFRAFPHAYQGFKVKVAVRMSASFPYISPAVSLPVEPPRRVVDAGYYDNYGVNLAASWAFENREWIQEHTSGLALVQIRAYESEQVRKRLWVEPRDPVTGKKPIGGFEKIRAGFFRGLVIGVQALTTPLKAVAGARQWSMSYRNDEQVSLLGEAFNDCYAIGKAGDRKIVNRAQESKQDGWFDTFVFENPLSFGMNWLITNSEIDMMKDCFDPRDGDPSDAGLSLRNLDQLNRLKAWWDDPREEVEYDLHLLPSGAKGPPPSAQGKNWIGLAWPDGTIQIGVFDATGSLVLEAGEEQLAREEREIEARKPSLKAEEEQLARQEHEVQERKRADRSRRGRFSLASLRKPASAGREGTPGIEEEQLARRKNAIEARKVLVSRMKQLVIQKEALDRLKAQLGELDGREPTDCEKLRIVNTVRTIAGDPLKSWESKPPRPDVRDGEGER